MSRESCPVYQFKGRTRQSAKTSHGICLGTRTCDYSSHMYRYIHIYTYRYIHGYIHINVCRYIHVYIYMHSFIHACIQVNIQICAYISIYSFMYIYLYIPLCIYVCIYVFIFINVYIYIYIYVYIFLYLRQLKGRPSEQGTSGFMSGNEQRHEIIAKLLVVAVSAAQIDQKPQQRWVLWLYIQIYMFVCVRV